MIDIVVYVSAILCSSLLAIGARLALTLSSQPEAVQAHAIVAKTDTVLQLSICSFIN